MQQKKYHEKSSDNYLLPHEALLVPNSKILGPQINF